MEIIITNKIYEQLIETDPWLITDLVDHMKDQFNAINWAFAEVHPLFSYTMPNRQSKLLNIQQAIDSSSEKPYHIKVLPPIYSEI